MHLPFHSYSGHYFFPLEVAPLPNTGALAFLEENKATFRTLRADLQMPHKNASTENHKFCFILILSLNDVLTLVEALIN